MSHCAVTGASGYVGGVIAEALAKQGHDVLELCRRPGSGRRPRKVHDLAAAVAPDMLTGVEVLIHCAYDFSVHSRRDIYATNVDGTRRLLEAAERAGVRRLVLISTLSAFPGSRSLYGKAKLEQEADFRRRAGAVVRPGLVFGAGNAGMMGALEKAVVRLPVVPLIGGGEQRLYPCHEADLGRLIVAVAQSVPSPDAPIVAASEVPITLRSILEMLALARGRRARFVTVPSAAAYWGLKVLEATGLRLRFSSDSLVSLANLDPHPDFTGTRRLGVAFRELSVRELSTAP